MGWTRRQEGGHQMNHEVSGHDQWKERAGLRQGLRYVGARPDVPDFAIQSLPRP